MNIPVRIFLSGIVEASTRWDGRRESREELAAYPKLVAAMDVMTQSAIAIMTPHLPHEGSAPSKGKAPSRRAKKQTEKSSQENPKENAR